jgi:predicted DNA-binding protein YlxM (UPF0122 family)
MKKLRFTISKAQFINLQKTYKTDVEIAKFLNVTRQYVFAFRKRFDLPIFKVSDTKINRNKLIYTDYSMRRVPKVDIAKKYNLTRMTVHRIIKKMEAK